MLIKRYLIKRFYGAKLFIIVFMKHLMHVICITTLLLMVSVTFAQKEPRSVRKRQEQLDKQEEVKKREGEKAHQEGIEQHMRIQTKETRKRMKKNKRKSKRVNDNRNEFFLKRWFS